MFTLKLFTLMLLLSCASAEITVKDELKKGSIKTIIIGQIENRLLGCNPFVVKNFCDALLFEFVRHGYNTKLINYNEEKASEILSIYDGDIFIAGSIYEGRFGDAIEDRTSAIIQLTLYAKSGNTVGTCRIISDETLSNARTTQILASKLMRAIHYSILGNN